MTSWWLSMREKIAVKTQRERLIITFLLCAVIYAIANFVIFAPIEKQKSRLDVRMSSVGVEMKKLSAQEKVLASALTNDPNAVKKREIIQLESRVAELDKDLETLSVGLISAEKLPHALRQVLESIGSLKLLGMKTRAPARLSLQEEREQMDILFIESDDSDESLVDELGAENSDVGIFKHSVEVSVEGKYFDLIRYLQSLEELTWKIYWEALDYEVTRYPKAKILIEVYTLSTEEGVLGV